VLLVVLLLCAAAAYFFTRPAEKKEKPKPVAPITTAVAVLKDMPLQLRSIGNVVPMNSVSVKSRVGGRIVEISFKEGQFVKKKDLLFTIDPRPLRADYMKAEADVLKQKAVIAQARAAIDKDKASLAQVRANLKKDQALARLAEVNAVRFGALAEAGAVSEVEAERRATDKESTAAIVIADEANINNAKAQISADEANLQNAIAQLSAAKAILENARVQLNYTTVNSPIAGRTGRILVLLGNNVRADEDILVTINQIMPIYVEFSVPAEQFELVQKYGKESLAVTAFLKGEKETRQGKVTFTDNTVDSTTGTVKLKAVFSNEDSALWPGKYVNVVLTLTTLRNVVTIPDQAVQTGQGGQFVWVVKNGKTAHMRKVSTGTAVGGVTVITSGINAGDVVVTDGQIQLSEDAKVQISEGQPIIEPQNSDAEPNSDAQPSDAKPHSDAQPSIKPKDSTTGSRP